ncbi:hypothetical protein [Desulfovibrio sp.]
MPFSRTPCSQCTCDSERDVPCGEQPKDESGADRSSAPLSSGLLAVPSGRPSN